MIRPDYAGGSIVNLMRTLGDACGARQPLPYAPLRNLKVSLLGTARNIVLLVIDGLGYDYLLRHGAGGALHRHLHSRLTSVFPSTTASAVTDIPERARAPAACALTGWHMYFSELGCHVAVLPLSPRGAGLPDALPPAPCRSSCSAMRPSSTCGTGGAAPPSPSPAIHRRLGLHPYHLPRRSAATRPDGIVRLCLKQDCAKINCAGLPLRLYYAELDTLANIHGVGSEPARRAVRPASTRPSGIFSLPSRYRHRRPRLRRPCGFIGFSRLSADRTGATPGTLAATLARPLCGERCGLRLLLLGALLLKPACRLCAGTSGECADLFSGSELTGARLVRPGARPIRAAARTAITCC
ncbi:MAG: hypothetical protein M5R42_09520 [Rhodocyclaceae bacterium]|nr:hypothetical protein [Rhodocyclaceae bacterium]